MAPFVVPNAGPITLPVSDAGTITVKIRDVYLFFVLFLVILAVTVEVAICRFAKDYHHSFWRMLFYRCVACGGFGHLGIDPYCPVVNATCFACAVDHRSKDCPVKKAKAEAKAKEVAKKDSGATNVDENAFGEGAEHVSLGEVKYEKSSFMDTMMNVEACSDQATGGMSSSGTVAEEPEIRSKYTLDVKPVPQRYFTIHFPETEAYSVSFPYTNDHSLKRNKALMAMRKRNLMYHNERADQAQARARACAEASFATTSATPLDDEQPHEHKPVVNLPKPTPIDRDWFFPASMGSPSPSAAHRILAPGDNSVATTTGSSAVQKRYFVPREQSFVPSAQSSTLHKRSFVPSEMDSAANSYIDSLANRIGHARTEALLKESAAFNTADDERVPRRFYARAGGEKESLI